MLTLCFHARFSACSQLTKKEVKQIADIFLKDVFSRADEKGIKIEVTEKFKDRCVQSFSPVHYLRAWAAYVCLTSDLGAIKFYMPYQMKQARQKCCTCFLTGW